MALVTAAWLRSHSKPTPQCTTRVGGGTVTGLEHAIVGLQQALDTPRRHQMWRWLVRHRMAGVKEALAMEYSRAGDSGLAARQIMLTRERDTLLRKLAALGPRVL